jgi:hypothetical protein
MDTGPLFGSQLGPAPTEGARAPFPETSQETSDPYILRDQMYGLNPTPVNNVSNALMRRYRSYYR